MFILKVTKNQITVTQKEVMTSGSQNVYPIEFQFSDEWNYLERVAVFATDVGANGPVENSVYNQLLKEDNRCFIPWEVNASHNKHVFVGVFGTMNGVVVLPTVWVDIGNVLLGVTTGVEIEDPTPTLYEQILGELNSIKGQLGSGGESEDPPPTTEEIPLSVLEYSNIDDGFQFISGGYLPKVFLFDHVTLKVYEEKARGLSSVYFNNEIVYIRREDEDPALYVTTMLGVTYKFSYDLDNYKFINLEIVDYEPESVEAFPTIKNQVVNSINVLDEFETSYPFCIHLVNSSLGGFFVNDLVWVNKSNNKLEISTIDGAKIKMSIDPESGELSLESLVRIGDRVDNLEGLVDTLMGRPTPENGVSPTIELTPIENGTRVTITDATGSKSFDIFNGQQGQQGIQGVQGEKGDPFSIAKVYSSIDEMNADYQNDNVSIGQFVVINTGNVEDEDNAKLFIKDQASYTFITDLSGAQGIEGPSGQNGVSPTVTIVEIDGGHRVSITDVDGTQTFDVLNGVGGSSPSISSTTQEINAPIGAIMPFFGTEDDVPQGWHVCNGEDGTVDLRDKFILGAGTTHKVGDAGGSEEVTLTVEQMPTHVHKISYGDNSVGTSTVALARANVFGGSLENYCKTTGGSEPHPNMPPYYTLLFIQKISASPSDYVTEERMDEKIQEALGNQNGSEDGVPSGFIGMWSGAVVPNGWALCDGTNGTPDLRGRFVLGKSGIHAIGETGGSEEVTLTVDQLPQHEHSYNQVQGSQKFTTNSSGASVFTGYVSTNTGVAGKNNPHPNMPPYYVLAYIMKL